jgi:hypothetical protein
VRVHAVTFNAANKAFKKDDKGWKQMVEESTEDAGESDIVFFGFQEFLLEDKFEEMAIDSLWNSKMPFKRRTFEALMKDLVEEIKAASRAPPKLHEFKDLIIEYLRKTTDDSSFDSDEFMRLVLPVMTWVGECVPRMRNVYPNLKITPEWFSKWRDQPLTRLLAELKKFNEMKAIAKQDTPKQKPEASAGGGGRSRTATMKHQLLRAMSVRILEDRGGRSSPTSARSSPTQMSDEDMIKDIETNLGMLLAGITDDPPQEIGRGDVKISMTTAKEHFYSGQVCHSRVIKHYDTALYAFVNPYSGWEITPEPYSAGECQPSPESQGCTMDHSDESRFEDFKFKKGECGKVVMLLRFKATRFDVASGVDFEIRICVLNTHMSMRKSTEQRLEFMKQAMDHAEEARCDLVVFVGDFNTRLRGLRSQLGPVHGQHPVMRIESDGQDTLHSVLDLFAVDPGAGQAVVQYRLDGGRGDMQSKSVDADEMQHMLYNEQAKCWQGKGEKENMEFEECPNPLFDRGLQELMPVPPFNPTYRVANEAMRKKKVENDKDKKVLVEEVKDMKKCYMNPSGQAKNNPAWTDRVLMWHAPKGTIKVELYTSVDLAKPDSDHMPVVGRVAYTMHGVPAHTFQRSRGREAVHGGLSEEKRHRAKQRKSSHPGSSDSEQHTL